MDAELEELKGSIDEIFSAYNRHLAHSGNGNVVVDVSEFEEKAISLAGNESLSHVNERQIREEGLQLSRRLTGGSAVMIDPGDFPYAIALPCGEEACQGSKADIFEEYLGPAIIDSCVDLGVSEERLGLVEENPEELGVLLDGKPLSGNSSYIDRKHDSLLFVGVVSINPWPAEELGNWIELRPGEEKYIERLPALSDELDYSASEISRAYESRFLENLAEYLSLEYIEGSLDIDDPEVQNWLNERYSTDEWLKRQSKEGREYRGFCLLTGDRQNGFELTGRYKGFSDLEAGDEILE